MTAGTAQIVAKICIHCGSEYSASSWDRSPCCSFKCRRERKVDRERQRCGATKRAATYAEKKCKRCNVVFWASSNQVYCEICIPVVTRERHQIYQYAYTRKEKAQKREQTAIEADKIFGTVCVLCGRERYTDRRHHLHRKNGEYHHSSRTVLLALKNPDDWVRLCIYCHKSVHWLLERGWDWERVEQEFYGKEV
jgi:hypothetical protein